MCGNFICENYDNLAFLKKVASSMEITGLPLMKYLLIKEDCEIEGRDKVEGNLDIRNF